jgi:large-conductance mechanosensitive channel
VATAAKADIDAKVVGYDKELAKFDQVRDLEAKASMDAYEYGLYQIQSTLATKVRAYEDDTRESGRNHTTEIAVATATASAEEQLYKQQHSAWHVFIDDVASSFQTTFSDFVSTFPDFILKGKMVDFAKFFKNIVGDILKSFTDMVSSMVTDWIKRFLTDTLINSTAKAAATAAKSLTDVVGKGVEDLTGKAAAGVGQLANVGGQAVAGAATSVINTVANVVTAAASVLELLKGPQKQTDVTYWLKMIKDLDQETHDRIKDIVAIMVYEQAQGDEKWNFMNTLNGLVAAGNNLLGDIAGGIRSMCSKIGATFDSGITRISSPISGANLAGLEPEYVVPESKVPGFVSAMSSPSSGRVTVEAKLIPLNPMLSAWAIGFFPKATKDEIVTVHPNGVRRK